MPKNITYMLLLYRMFLIIVFQCLSSNQKTVTERGCCEKMLVFVSLVCHPKGFLPILSQVEWVQQQVVKRRIKRDYKPSYPGPVQSSMVQSNSIYFNDAKWSSMWYIVSILISTCCKSFLWIGKVEKHWRILDHCHGLYHFPVYFKRIVQVKCLTKVLQWMIHQAHLILKGKMLFIKIVKKKLP